MVILYQFKLKPDCSSTEKLFYKRKLPTPEFGLLCRKATTYFGTSTLVLVIFHRQKSF